MRIFISHGTDKTRPEELTYLDTLEARLAAAPSPHDVLLDRTRIGAGDDWEGLLHDAIAECQAAVLLLSPRALDRPWVLKEATLLSYRKAREAVFPFFCVLLPGVTHEDLASRPAFAALKLDRIQAFAAGSTAQAVADWVREHAATVVPPADTPLDRLERALEARLAHVDSNELEAICERLLGEKVAWVASTDRARLRARVLARGIARGQLARVGGITALSKSLKAAGLVEAHLREVLKLAASMWVDDQIAGRLAALVALAEGAEPFAAALNGKRFKWSPRMVAWRALLPDTDEFIYWVEGGGSDGWADEVVRRIRRAYRKGKEDTIDDEEQVDEILRARTTPIVYVLPEPFDDTLLRALRTRYPRVTFIVHTGPALRPPSELPSVVVPLSPGIDIDTEVALHADFTATLEVR